MECNNIMMDSKGLQEEFSQLDSILDPFEFSIPDFIPVEDYLSTTAIELAATPNYSDTSTNTQPQIIVENNRFEGEGKKSEAVSKVLDRNRLKRKIEKTKQRLPEKGRSKDDMELTKKQQQLLRNRISAQKSRDRKKQELIELSDENKKLRESEAQLQTRLFEAQSEIELNKQIIGRLSENSQSEYYKVRNELLNNTEEWRYSRGFFRNPLLMATALLGTICMIALVSPSFISNPSQAIDFNQRILVENRTNQEVLKEYCITESM